MATLAIRDIPIGFAYLSSNQKAGVKVYVIAVGQRNERVELVKCFRIVIVWPGLKPCPDEIESDSIETELVHMREVRFYRLRVPLKRPLHGGSSGNPISAYGNEAMSITREVVGVQTDGW
jgi:hypothetical protein